MNYKIFDLPDDEYSVTSCPINGNPLPLSRISHHHHSSTPKFVQERVKKVRKATDRRVIEQIPHDDLLSVVEGVRSGENELQEEEEFSVGSRTGPGRHTGHFLVGQLKGSMI